MGVKAVWSSADSPGFRGLRQAGTVIGSSNWSRALNQSYVGFSLNRAGDGGCEAAPPERSLGCFLSGGPPLPQEPMDLKSWLSCPEPRWFMVTGGLEAFEQTKTSPWQIALG